MALKDPAEMSERVARLHTPEAYAKRMATIHSPEYKERVARTRQENKLEREKIKNYHKLAKYMMEAEIPDEDEAAIELMEHGFEGADYQTAVFWGQLKKAIYSSDTEAAKYVRDTAGYKPTESMQIGNLDDKPFTQIDLSKLSNEELMQMIAKREKIEEE